MDKKRARTMRARKKKRMFGVPAVWLAFLLLIGCVSSLMGNPGSAPAENELQTQAAPIGQPTEDEGAGISAAGTVGAAVTEMSAQQADATDISHIPAYSGTPYVAVNGNMPEFADSDRTAYSFERYSELDALGRCGPAYACIGTDLMPTQERGSIGQIKPSGWHLVKYDVVDGAYLYNRCHLIGYQLTGENSNEKNLITGTRYLNVEGMLPFENRVADYIKETGNHVLYRVTPVFEGDNLLAHGVQMEAESLEDGGEGISFNVYCYNVQPGIRIDYATGESELDGSALQQAAVTGVEPAGQPAQAALPNANVATYILNANTHKFHELSCSGASDINENNRQEFTGTREEAIAMGYDPCGICHP